MKVFNVVIFRLKATKARNEYMLCMDSANASIRKYFVDDLFDLIDVSRITIRRPGYYNRIGIICSAWISDSTSRYIELL